MILRDYLNWRRFYPEGVLVVSAELSKCYELLGVNPGVSAQELKTAHRDMAKVWHPDRFSHDPRLQQKAQEKLKQINEAYDQLTLRKGGFNLKCNFEISG